MKKTSPHLSQLQEDLLSALSRSERLRAHITTGAHTLGEEALQVQAETSDAGIHRVAGELYDRARRVEDDLGRV